jgi:sortase A
MNKSKIKRVGKKKLRRGKINWFPFIKNTKKSKRLKIQKKQKINFVKKRKVLRFLIIAFVLLLLFWWWLKVHLDNKVENADISFNNQQINLTNSTNEQKDKNGAEITFENLGDFWLEIKTENLEIKAPVVEGVTPERLDQGLGHHRSTAFPNSETGNVVISGHRWLAGDNPTHKIFENLDQLQIGDEIKIHYQDKEFTYKINEEKTVKSNEVGILEQTEKPQITLYTCTPKFTSFRRLVFVGELVK